MKKGVLAMLLVALLLIFLGACSKMPFNGDMEFHSISLTVPERFIRDSIQSKEDFWIFEHGNYAEVVLLSRKDASAADAQSALSDYVESMKQIGAKSEIHPFLSGEAVFSAYEKDGVFCQEVLFLYDHSYYAIALRGGTESGFQEIVNTIRINVSSVAA